MSALLLASVADSGFNLVAARVQMAFTLSAHITLAVFGVGMPLLVLAAEWRTCAPATGSGGALAHRWSKVFAVLFAVGAVSGTVLSFELGLLWPTFMGRYGAAIGFPFAMEGFAFFLEAIFVGIYLYGWNRLPPWIHWRCGWPIAISGVASAWFVVTVNAWMNCPRGFRIEDGKLVDVDPVAAMLNPCAWPQAMHMIVAAYMVTGFAWPRSTPGPAARHETTYYRRAMSLGLLMGTRDHAAAIRRRRLVGQGRGRNPAGQAGGHGGPVSDRGRCALAHRRVARRSRPATTNYAIEIPGMLSLLAYHDRDAVVSGLDDFPSDETPPVAVVHVAFQVMVGAAGFLMFLSLWTLAVGAISAALPHERRFLWLVVCSGPLAWLAWKPAGS